MRNKNVARHSEKRITVVFRYDDYSNSSSTETEAELLHAFHTYHIPCTFGVIPYTCDRATEDPVPQSVVPLTLVKADLLRRAVQAGLLEVAQHGYSHQTILSRSQGGWTEFAGLGLREQIQKIVDGKRLLQEMLNMQVVTFTPPWNSYDLNTTTALEDTGFTCISAGRTGVVRESSQLGFLPSTCSLFNLQDAVRTAQRFVDAQPVIVALCHAYDFAVNQERGKLTYQDLDELLAWVTSQKDVDVRTIGEAVRLMKEVYGTRHHSRFASLMRQRLISLLLKNQLPFYPSRLTLGLVTSQFLALYRRTASGTSALR